MRPQMRFSARQRLYALPVRLYLPRQPTGGVHNPTKSTTKISHNELPAQRLRCNHHWNLASNLADTLRYHRVCVPSVRISLVSPGRCLCLSVSASWYVPCLSPRVNTYLSNTPRLSAPFEMPHFVLGSPGEAAS